MFVKASTIQGETYEWDSLKKIKILHYRAFLSIHNNKKSMFQKTDKTIHYRKNDRKEATLNNYYNNASI